MLHGNASRDGSETFDQFHHQPIAEIWDMLLLVKNYVCNMNAIFEIRVVKNNLNSCNFQLPYFIFLDEGSLKKI